MKLPFKYIAILVIVFLAGIFATKLLADGALPYHAQ